ncbi:hypothetical protein ACFPES_14585 [Paenibacillus sp. GCM10023248]|uniref:hypothetical protein n=1 Tax=Bacillales TaxID=1385 RepID=UPI002379AF7B|nr:MULTISPECIES: hypothetical protein [Bacillales]MDD9268263.1 hypothetical protein [Paenibacillus sp. MAHUQ-63]MDR6879941.1 putative membrane protein [Bacillus sp. 3255]
MPATKKENVYFGLMMCSGMVIFMTTYNLFTNGLIGRISMGSVLLQLLLGFIVAFLLESFIVGPVAKKMALSLPYDKSKKALVIVSIALFMVTGMVLCMSLFGVVMAMISNGLMGETFIEKYVSTVCRNFIFALPLQLLIVGPVVRYVFVKFVKTTNMANSAS